MNGNFALMGFIWVILFALSPIIQSCSFVETSICGDQKSKNEDDPDKSEDSSAQGAEATPGEDAPKQYQYLYSRSRNLIDAVQDPESTKPSTHMCAYLAKSSQPFKSTSALLAAVKINPKVAEIESLFPYFTSNQSLASKVNEFREANANEWASLAFHLSTIRLGELDDFFWGQDFRAHDIRITYAALVYGKLIPAEENSNSADAAKNSLEIQLDEGTKGSYTDTLKQQFLKSALSEEPTILSKFFRQHGMKNPPESILRLPIERLAEYPCPEY